ncbi:hypothetical protein CSPX01_01177, partial [Colletotrichum filicis]
QTKCRAQGPRPQLTRLETKIFEKRRGHCGPCPWQRGALSVDSSRLHRRLRNTRQLPCQLCPELSRCVVRRILPGKRNLPCRQQTARETSRRRRQRHKLCSGLQFRFWRPKQAPMSLTK